MSSREEIATSDLGRPRIFKIRGLDCADEVAVLRREIGALAGGEDRLSFDVLQALMTVKASPGEVSDREILEAVKRTGMRGESWAQGREEPAEQGVWKRRERTLLTAASGVAGAAGLITHAAMRGGFAEAWGSEAAGLAYPIPMAARLLYAAAIVTGTWHVVPKAWLALRRLAPDMNLLMSTAILGALILGDWLEAATVAFLFALALTLETWSVGRARRAIASLLDLAPAVARLLRPDGGEEEIPAERVEIGAHLIVKPGERIPLDGRIVRGASGVDQAPITGESVPVPKDAGDEVFAGTINGDGALEIETTRGAADTTLARIIRMVEEARSRRAPAEQWVERFARVYTPAVMILALAVALVPPLASGGGWAGWFYRALVLLVIACPCALVISTPVSVVAALTAAARNGVLVKGGLFLEMPARLKAIAFDKTGTLTRGRPAVVEVVPLTGHDQRSLLERAAALEARSEHPLGHAILAFAEAQNVPVAPAEDFQSLRGRGATGLVHGRGYWLGSRRYLAERGQETEKIRDLLEVMSQGGRTVVVVGTESHVCGLISVADPVRPEARDTMRALHRIGVERLVMLTGDNRDTARSIAQQTGLADFRSELLPEQKVRAIEDLVAHHGYTAMVGDGVNDAPAMARASLSIGMGVAGSDAAIETADVVLMSDSLAGLPWLIRHSRRLLRVVRQNIACSLVVKAIFVILVFAGHASMWTAIAADMGASLAVISNGLRLLVPPESG